MIIDDHKDALLGFAIMMTCAAVPFAIAGWQELLGFVMGILVTLAAAAVASGGDDY